MATTVNTLETDTEVFKGDRVIADGVERELGDVTVSGVAGGLVSSTNPFGDGSLVAKYEMENNANDTTGTYNGIEYGGASTYSVAKYGNGLNTAEGKEIKLDLNLGSTFSLSFWAKCNTVDSTLGVIFSAGWDNSANARTGLLFGTSYFGKTLAINCGSDDTWRSTGIDFTDLAFISITYDGTTLKVYNGTVETLSFATTVNITTRAVIGSFIVSGETGYSTAYGVDGILDQVEIYNRALTDGTNGTVDEIGLLYTQTATKYSADFNTPLASTPTSVYRLDHDNLTISGTPTATTATVLDSRTGLIATGDTVLLDGVGVICNPVVETEVSGLEPDGSLNVSTTDAVPTMTSNTAPSGVVSSNSIESASYDAYKAFINDNTAAGSIFWTTAASVVTGWLQYKFDTSKIINKYTIEAINYVGDITDRSPKDWTIKASNTGAFAGEEVVLDTVVGETAWARAEKRTFTFTNGTAYLYYRIDITANDGSTTNLGIGEMELIEAVNDAIEYQYDLTYPTQTAPTRIALSNNDIVPTVASETFDGVDTFTRTYNKVTKTARDVEYGFVGDTDVEVVQVNINQNMEP